VQFIPANDVDAVKAAFDEADRDGVFFEGIFIEPVMGEGDSGLALTREFYDAVRALSREHGAMLVVDSIQAALRAHGCLSIIDYPGFGDCEPPDMETYSKALNAGQFPLSVLALNDRAAEAYGQGTYGNTMTTNPRALEVGCSVLDSLTEDLRKNVRARGKQLLEGLKALAGKHPDAIREVRGTGLIVCADLEPGLYQVEGRGGFEEYLRTNGIVMIHGGHNGLRFTPHLAITSEEIALILEKVEDGLTAMRRAS
jgi:acetylornithine/succinyldiaminopimelate/putrescine aminotransferase